MEQRFQQQIDSGACPGNDSTPPWLEKNTHDRIPIKLKITIRALHVLEEYAKQARGFELYSTGNKKSL